jgi:agmatine deiminase
LRKNKTSIEKNPAARGFRMPAEWEPHEATWIAWPHNPTDWPGRFQPIAWVYADIVRHLSRVERVHIIVNDAAAKALAQKLLTQANVPANNIEFHLWPTNRVWTRDSGAIFIRNTQAEVAATDWRFNAWAKYPDWKLDDQVAGKMARKLGVASWQPSISVGGKQVRVVLEGGSIDVNGRGTMLTTEECLLSEVQQRNPGLSRTDVERVFAEYLGVSKVIWLKNGIVGDDTHGHVDDLARFVAPNTVVTMTEADRSDENHGLLQENVDLLRTATDQDGNRLKVVMLQMPAPVIIKGQRVPASYANFYIANGLVLVPTFNDPNDRAALNTLAELFPGRKIVGIHCGDFIWGLGAIHCMTQQQPRSGLKSGF